MRNSFQGVPWQKDGDDAVRLFVHLTPKSSKDAVEEIIAGPGGTVLKARVRAIPDKGKANQALIRLISKWLKWPKSSIEIVKGGQSRYKTLKITGESVKIIANLKTAINSG